MLMDNMNNQIENIETNIENENLNSEQLATLTNKIDEVIAYQQNSYALSLTFLAFFFSIIVIYLIYKFIINFIEF